MATVFTHKQSYYAVGGGSNYIWHDLTYTAVRRGLDIDLTFHWWGYWINGYDHANEGIYFSAGIDERFEITVNGVSFSKQIKHPSYHWSNWAASDDPTLNSEVSDIWYRYWFDPMPPYNATANCYGVKQCWGTITIPNVTGSSLSVSSRVYATNTGSLVPAEYDSLDTIAVPALVLPTAPAISRTPTLGSKDSVVTITATGGDGGSGNIYQYQFQAKIGSGSWQNIQTSASASCALAPSSFGATHGSLVSYRVVLYNDLGYSATSGEVTYQCVSQPTAPAIAVDVTVVPEASSNITLNITETDASDTYKVYAKRNSDTPVLIATLTSPSAVYTVAGLNASLSPDLARGDSLYFQVYRVNQYGVMSATATTSAAIVYLSLPSNPVVAALPVTEHCPDIITASWSASTQAQSQALRYTVKIHRNGVLVFTTTTAGTSYAFAPTTHGGIPQDTMYVTVQAYLTNYTSVVSSIIQSSSVILIGAVLRLKAGGTWYTSLDVFTKVLGTWRKGIDLFRKVSGTWRRSL